MVFNHISSLVLTNKGNVKPSVGVVNSNSVYICMSVNPNFLR